jgi:hypothetical protein
MTLKKMKVLWAIKDIMVFFTILVLYWYWCKELDDEESSCDIYDKGYSISLYIWELFIEVSKKTKKTD